MSETVQITLAVIVAVVAIVAIVFGRRFSFHVRSARVDIDAPSEGLDGATKGNRRVR